MIFVGPGSTTSENRSVCKLQIKCFENCSYTFASVTECVMCNFLYVKLYLIKISILFCSKSNATTPNNVYQEPCQALKLPDVTHKVRLSTNYKVVCILNELCILWKSTLSSVDKWHPLVFSCNINPCQSPGFDVYCKYTYLFSLQISFAVDTLTGELSCKLGKNGSFQKNKSSEVEQNLRQVVESTLRVILDLVKNYII